MKKDLSYLIKLALAEDVGKGDYTSFACVSKNEKKEAFITTKENCIISGIKLAKMIFKEIDLNLKVSFLKHDGDKVVSNENVLRIYGSSMSILKGERVVLNYMQRMSGISTKTHYLVKLIEKTGVILLDTRKTTPLNRMIEKSAVKFGGAKNHRFNLSDMIIIKDNHVKCSGSIKNAIQATTNFLIKKKLNLKVVIEAQNLREVKQIVNFGNVDRILLDNFSIQQTRKAIEIINHKFQTESSGGINEKNIREYANCGVNFISVGDLTHNIKGIDLSLNFK